MILFLRQTDGLGNQLFQYAASFYFARLYNADLRIIRDPITVSPSGSRPRPFMLSHFCISAPVYERTSWHRLVCTVEKGKRPLGAIARLASRTRLYQQHLKEAWIFQPALDVTPSTAAFYLKGFWQAHQFAAAVEPQLREELRFKEAPQGQTLHVLRAVEACAVPVSLHVRRGDYTTLNGGKLALPMTYYHNAIQRVKARWPDASFFVFSDDIPFAKEQLAGYKGVVFVDHNDEAHAHEDLRLMSSCHHHIIANSTLSWWGAWLNPRPGKVVFAPDRWLDPELPATDLLPPTWVQVPTETVQS